MDKGIMSWDNTRKAKKLSRSMIESIHNRQGGVCLYCGGYVNINLEKGRYWNVEHIVPRAVYKWLEYEIPEDEADKLFNEFENKNNLAICHCSCNTSRGSDLKINLDSLYCSDETKEIYKEHFKKLSKYIDMYLDIIKDLLNNQNNECDHCKLPLTVNKAVIRRKEYNKIRSRNNGRVVCKHCNKLLIRW